MHAERQRPGGEAQLHGLSQLQGLRVRRGRRPQLRVRRPRRERDAQCCCPRHRASLRSRARVEPPEWPSAAGARAECEALAVALGGSGRLGPRASGLMVGGCDETCRPTNRIAKLDGHATSPIWRRLSLSPSTHRVLVCCCVAGCGVHSVSPWYSSCTATPARSRLGWWGAAPRRVGGGSSPATYSRQLQSHHRCQSLPTTARQLRNRHRCISLRQSRHHRAHQIRCRR